MALPGAHLFPGTILPLYIFEERYRLMTSRALAEERMFCIALARGSGLGFHDVGTIGLIRACVNNADGTFHLLLQGLHRVEFTARQEEVPYPVARLRFFPDRDAATPEALELAERLYGLCGTMKASGIQLPTALGERALTEGRPDLLAGVAASSLVGDAAVRQSILEELSVPARLRMVIGYLEESAG